MQTDLQINNAVVTGATGFIGRWLLLELTRSGVAVCALIREADARLGALRAWVDAHGGDGSLLDAAPLELLEDDLGLDPCGRQRLAEAEVVYHLAARFGFGLPANVARRANVDASVRLVELLSASSSLRRLVHLSGYRTQGTPARRLDVDDPVALARYYREHGAYEASKVEAHARVAQAAAAHGVPLTRISPSTVIGDSRTGETTQLTGLAETLELLWRGRLPVLPGGAQTWLPVVTVDFLAALLARLPADPPSEGAHVLVFDDRTPTLPALIHRIADRMGVAAPRATIPAALLRWLPTALTGVHPEALSFVSTDRYDPRPLAECTDRLGLIPPPLDASLDRWVDFLLDTRFGARPAQGGRSFDAAGTRVFGRGDRRRASHVFLHGVMLNEASWSPVTRSLHEPFLAVDLPGLGHSADGGGHPGEWLRGVLATADEPPVLVAHSLGSAFALEYAAAHPERTAGLVLVSPFFLQARPSLPLRLPWLMRWVFRFLGSRATAEVLEAPPDDVRSDTLASLRRPGIARAHARWLSWASRARVRARLVQLLSTTEVPITLIHGARDPLVVDPPERCRRIAIPGAGHHPQLSHPEAILAALGGGSPPQQGHRGEVLCAEPGGHRRLEPLEHGRGHRQVAQGPRVA